MPVPETPEDYAIFEGCGELDEVDPYQCLDCPHSAFYHLEEGEQGAEKACCDYPGCNCTGFRGAKEI